MAKIKWQRERERERERERHMGFVLQAGIII